MQTIKSQNARTSLLLYGLVLMLLSYSWIYDKVKVHNERSRIYLAVALVDHGTIAIDKPFERFGKINDFSIYKDHRFTDKAPGSGFIAAALYGFVRLFTSPKSWTSVEIINLIRTWLMIPLGLIGFFLLRRILSARKISKETVDIVSLGWILGSAAFHYSTVFYGHQIVAVLFLTALNLLAVKKSSATLEIVIFFAVGLCCGLAVFTEYQSIIFCASLTVYLFVKYRTKHLCLVSFCAGAAVFATLLLLYNRSAYGGCFELSYHHLTEEMQQRHGTGVAGVLWPDPSRLFNILFSVHRGLMPTAPMYLCLFLGLYFMYKEKERGLAATLSVSFLGYLIFISGAVIWHGGWAFGPRLLVPILGVMALPVARAYDRLRKYPKLFAILVGFVVWGLLYNQFAHVVFPSFPTRSFNPMVEIILPAFKQELFTPNIFSEYFGLHGYISIVGAMLLLTATIVFVMFRQWQILNKLSSNNSRISLGIPWIIGAILIGSILLYGRPFWTEKKTGEFVDWLHEHRQ